MTAPREQLPGNYPIEIDFPVITGYTRGNTGIPYVHSFDSGEAGPHLMVNCLTHGNEVCGAVVVKRLLDLEVRPLQGKLTLAFANVDAYHSFDSLNPDKSRFVDQDLNRVWSPQTLDNAAANSIELRRARELRPVIDTVDLLLDIHSMHEKSSALLLSGPLDKGIELARQVAVPGDIIVDAGHSDGRRLRDYELFGQAASPRNALLVECGQHWAAASLAIARQCCARFLEVAGLITPGCLPPEWTPRPSAKPRVIHITDAITATSTDFQFAGPYRGLESFPKAGAVIAWNAGVEVSTPYDDCILVMPSLRQLRPGVTVARLGRVAY